MGVSVRQKRPGVYYVFARHGDLRRSKKCGQKEVAERVKEIIEGQIALGDLSFFKKSSRKTGIIFKHYSDIWVNTILPATCKPSTMSDYKGILENHVHPVFKTRLITEIKRSDIKNFLLDKHNSGLAQSTVTHIKNVISGVLTCAVDDEIIVANPAQSLGKLFKKTQTYEKIQPYTAKELQSFLSAIQKHFPREYPLALTLARTGMRIGEAIALKWTDMSFENQYIVLRRSFSRGKIGTIKNNKPRNIDMSRHLSGTLAQLQHARKLEN